MLSYKDLKIKTSPDVYVPAEDSFLAAEAIEFWLSKVPEERLSVLDMGSGSGILGLTAARDPKVESITFVDINDEALSLSSANLELNRDSINANASFIHSHLFENVKNIFDLIIFNAPYLVSGGEEGMLPKAWEGGLSGIELSKEFLGSAMSYLNPNGAIILVASSHSNLASLLAEIGKKGFRILNEKKEHIFFEDIIVYTLIVNPNQHLSEYLFQG